MAVRGKRVVITGATSGIGLAAATQLVALGASLTIVARNPARAQAALARLKQANKEQEVDVLYADLSSQAAVRRLAAEITGRYARLDVLINNAGAIYSTRQLTVEGIERTWAVNHLAPFLLTTLVLDLLKSSAPARIITTASGAHHGAHIPFDDLNADHGYPAMGYRRYGETKLANILFTAELARRLQGTGVTANCFHPGFVATGFNRNNQVLMRWAMRVGQLFARPPEKAAETLVWLADSPDVADVSGLYFVDKLPRQPSRAARDEQSAQRLWQVSQEQTAEPLATRT
jgi:NAD(P)-dependent dehydrogenase (short-subunit alcohol dehydrogenase family)